LIIKELKNIIIHAKWAAILRGCRVRLHFRPKTKNIKIIFARFLLLCFLIKINAQNNAANQLDLARQMIANNDYKRAYIMGKESAIVYQNDVVLYAEALTIQGNALRRMTEYDKAESTLKTVVNIREKRFGRRSLETSNALQNLANVFLDRDMPNHAMPLLNETESIRQQMLSPQHEDIAKVQEALGTCYTQKQDYPRAIDYYLKAAQHPYYQTSDMYINIANGYSDLGDPAQAHTFLRMAMSLIRPDNFDFSVEKAELLTNLGLCQRRLGNSKSAIEYLENAIAIYDKLGKYNKELAKNYLNVGMLLHDDCLYKAAIAYFQKAMNQHKNDAPFTANVYLQIGLAYSECDDLVEAQRASEKGIQILRGLAQQSNPIVLIELYLNKAKIEIKKGYFKQAKQDLNQVEETLKTLPKNNQAYALHLRYLSTYAELSKAELPENQSIL
jgi:tetratricopeptide (TPR) repeat protein